MNNEKGITLVSLILYIIGLVAVMAIVGTLITFFNKNINNMNNVSDVNSEFTNFETSMLLDTKDSSNYITNITTTSIEFVNGNKYVFQDGKIYKNYTVLCNYVTEFESSMQTDGNKQILTIYIAIEKGNSAIVKNMKYVIENVKIENDTLHFITVESN